MSSAGIAPVLERYAQAVIEKNLEAFISLYDAEARVFDAWGRWAYDGIDAWRATVRGWFESLGDERIAVSSEGLRITVDGDLASACRMVVYTATAPDGKPLHSMRNRLTWVLRRREGTWKVLHEHTSVPLDFETKAMLREG